MIILVAIFLILFEACFEGLHTGGHFIASEIVEFVYLAVITFCLFAYLMRIKLFKQQKPMMFWKIIVGYVLLRFALFDIVFNLSAGLSLNFIGDTKLFDQALQWIKDMWGMSPIWFVKFVAGFWGTMWLIGYKQ